MYYFYEMNQPDLINKEHLIESDSVLEELIDHIGELLAEEYFHLMEESSHQQNDVIELFEE